eukprot:1195914-Pyramimonas_sp.AAC.1
MSRQASQLQLCPVTKQLRRAYNEASQLSTGGPRSGLLPGGVDLTSCLGASLEVLDVDCLSKSIKFRILMSCSGLDVMQYHVEALAASLDGDGFTPARTRWSWWRQPGIGATVGEIGDSPVTALTSTSRQQLQEKKRRPCSVRKLSVTLWFRSAPWPRGCLSGLGQAVFQPPISSSWPGGCD